MLLHLLETLHLVTAKLEIVLVVLLLVALARWTDRRVRAAPQLLLTPHLVRLRLQELESVVPSSILAHALWSGVVAPRAEDGLLRVRERAGSLSVPGGWRASDMRARSRCARARKPPPAHPC